MVLKTEEELEGMTNVCNVVANVLKEMVDITKVGMTTNDLDNIGGNLLNKYGAISAPIKDYKFPRHTCISVNEVFVHGVPNDTILKEGDLINIDVSAVLNGYYGDNGCSFIIGEDINGLQPLVDASKKILLGALNRIKRGVVANNIGNYIENQAKEFGFKTIRNLLGHGIGKSLHDNSIVVPNYNSSDNKRFKKGMCVAIETFISTESIITKDAGLNDGWSLIGDKGGYVAQHEHTIIVTDSKPIILTKNNEILL